MSNALRIYHLLVLDATAGRPSADHAAPPPPYPKLELAYQMKGA